MNKKVIEWLDAQEKTVNLGSTPEIRIPRTSGTVKLTPSQMKKEIEDGTVLGQLVQSIIEEDLKARGLL